MLALDTLMLALGVDTRGMDKGLNEAQRKMQAASKSLANSLLSPMKAAFGALAAGLGLGAMTNQYLQQADAIGKMADSIGADVEELQAWGEAATRAGGSAQGFYGSIQNLNRMLQMTAVSGKGPAALALQQFGIKATDAGGKARDSFEILRDLAGVMEGMDKQKAMGFGQRLGLDRGTIMLLQSGRAATEDLIARQKELGVYTKEDTELAAKANDAIADLQQSLKSAAAVIMRVIAPAITWIAKKLTALSQDFKEHKALYLAGIGMIAALISAKLIPSLAKTLALSARIWAPFALLGSLIAALALVFEDFWVYIHGGESALEDLWKSFGTGPELLAKWEKSWEKVKEKSNSVLNGLKALAVDVFDYFITKIDSIIGIFDGLFTLFDGLVNFDFRKIGQGLGEAFYSAAELIGSIFDDIFEWIGSISWEGIKTGAGNAVKNIKQLFLGFFESLPKDAQEKLGRLWDEIKNIFKVGELATNLWNAFKNTVEQIKKAFKDWITELVTDIINIPKKVMAGITGAGKAVADVASSIGNPEDYLNSDEDHTLNLAERMASSGGGGATYYDNKTINQTINGAGNPDAVGKAAAAEIERGTAGSLAKQAMNGNRF